MESVVKMLKEDYMVTFINSISKNGVSTLKIIF